MAKCLELLSGREDLLALYKDIDSNDKEAMLDIAQNSFKELHDELEELKSKTIPGHKKSKFIAPKIDDEIIAAPKPKKGEGKAKEALQQIVDIADENGVAIELDVVPENTSTSKDRLVSLYEGFGFVMDKDSDTRMVRKPKQKESFKPLTKEEIREAEEVKKSKKTLFNRAYSGQTDEEIKKAIARHGLTREVESEAIATDIANQIIAEVGLENAFEAVNNRQIGGAPAALIAGRMVDFVKSKMEGDISQQEADELMIAQANVLNVFDSLAKESGRLIKALQWVYEKSDFTFDYEYQVELFKRVNGGEISLEQEAQIKKITDELSDLKKKLEEVEEKHKKELEQQIIDGIKDHIQKSAKKKAPQKLTGKKRVAKGLEDLLKATGSISMAVGEVRPEITKALTDIGIGLIEEGVATTENVIKKLADYLKKNNVKNVKLNDYKESIQTSIDEYASKETTGGKMKIPHAMIRELVEAGYDTMDSLVAAVKDVVLAEYPEVTDREIMDAISGYGRTINQSKDQLDKEIYRMKRVMRLTSALEDVRKKIRPKKSGLQRDKLTSEERALSRELRELMKDLPIDQETLDNQLKTSLDRSKSILQNQIEDLQNEIDAKERTEKKARTAVTDAELEQLKEERDAIKKIHDSIFRTDQVIQEEKLGAAIKAAERTNAELERKIRDKDLERKKTKGAVETVALKSLRDQKKKLQDTIKQLRDENGITEQERINQARDRAKKRIADINRKIKEKDFAPAPKKKIISDAELDKIRAEILTRKHELDKHRYLAELANQNKVEKTGRLLRGLWDISRILKATGEASWIGIQNGIYTVVYGLRKPSVLKEAGKNLWDAFASKSKGKQLTKIIQSSPQYPLMKDSKLSITEENAKLSAQEEQFIGTLFDEAWNLVGFPLRVLDFAPIKGKTIYESWKDANFPAALERANIAYSNTLKVARFQDAVAMLEKQGISYADDPKAYKNAADVVNTFSGRSSLGRLDPMADSLTFMFFSPRLWASTLKQASPAAMYWVGYSLKDQSGGKFKPSVAQKMAIIDFMTSFSLTMSAVLMAAAYYNNDDDDETGVNFDPTSTDFMQIKIGNTRVDPWAGKRPLIVLQARLLTQASAYAFGKKIEAEEYWQTRPPGELLLNYARNKLAPSASLVANYMLSSQKEEDGEMILVDSWGNPLTGKDASFYQNVIPIYAETLIELYKEQPVVMATFLTSAAFFGIGTNTYNREEKKKKKGKNTSEVDIPQLDIPDLDIPDLD